MGANLELMPGEAGDETDMSVCEGEKGDIILAVDERIGASRAMAEHTPRPSRIQGLAQGCRMGKEPKPKWKNEGG